MTRAGGGINYIRSEIAAPPESRRRGTQQQATVPASLDLAERARLAVNGMTEPTDPDTDYRVYWKVTFRSSPPVMYHDFSDTGITMKFMESVPRMRMMSGSEQGLHVEQRWKEALLRMIAPDGLVATPMVGRDYFRPNAAKQRGSSFTGSYEHEQIIDMQVNGLALGAVATFAALDDRAFWEPIGRGIVDGLTTMAVHEGEVAYFPKAIYAPSERGDPGLPRPLGTLPAFAMWPARRLIPFYLVTGYKPALDLAGRLCRYMPEQSQYFGPNFEFLSDDPDPAGARHDVVHFHHHAMTILAWVEYGLAAGDDAMLQMAQQAFDKAKTYGECLTGFFPESVGDDVPHTAEICEVGDMVRVAVKLAAAGMGDAYWDDADCWVRNQLAEGQLLRHDWIHRLHLADPPTQLAPHMTAERVGERNIGSFAGWQGPNEWVEFQRGRDRGGVREITPEWQSSRESWDEYVDRAFGPQALGHVQGVMHCCTANGTRALYDAWRHTVHIEGDRIAVNLLLNHTSRALHIDCHLPYTGQVDLHVKQEGTLSVRLPGWVALSQVVCVVDERPRSLHFDGRYAQVGEVHPAQTVRLTFPVSEQVNRVSMKNQWYFLVRKGHDIVCIDPPGTVAPLYQRDHYRENVTLWKQTTRYLDEQLLDW